MIVGTIGSGKSSIGRRLAKHYGIPFIDSDTEIEMVSGCSIKDFFELYGEEEFRICERKVLKRLLNGQRCVLSSGGGAFLDPQTREIAKEKALTVWLKADENVLYRRLKGRERRPNIPKDSEELRKTITELLRQEGPIYSQADITVESLEETAEKTMFRTVKALQAFTNRQENDTKKQDTDSL